MPVETAELQSGIRYYWRCPVCLEISLPCRNPELAADEGRRHVGCAVGSRR